VGGRVTRPLILVCGLGAQTTDDGWYRDLTSGTVVVDAAVANRVLQKGATGMIWIYRTTTSSRATTPGTAVGTAPSPR
jgi:hypothetical protein